jgi:hypothetical protein
MSYTRHNIFPLNIIDLDPAFLHTKNNFLY